MNIDVTSEHIKRGDRTTLHNPIALAIQEHDEYAVVTRTKAHVTCAHGRSCVAPFCGVIPLHDSIVTWLNVWHAHRYVAPFRFWLAK